MTCENRDSSRRTPKYGPNEIALRHQLDRLSLLVSAARPRVLTGDLADTVVRVTYPSILEGVNALDKNRACAKRFRGEMTEYCLETNEASAALLKLHAEVCSDVLRANIEVAA